MVGNAAGEIENQDSVITRIGHEQAVIYRIVANTVRGNHAVLSRLKRS